MTRSSHWPFSLCCLCLWRVRHLGSVQSWTSQRAKGYQRLYAFFNSPNSFFEVLLLYDTSQDIALIPTSFLQLIHSTFR